jgi:ubiquinone biosynthesis monooxygenase Coq7
MLSLADRWIVEFDRALRTLSGVAHPSRPSPAAGEDLTELLPEERSQSGALMRVDHSGEVCAQALYSGQALTARDPARREALLQAAREEGDHLAWTRDRLRELALEAGAAPDSINVEWEPEGVNLFLHIRR